MDLYQVSLLLERLEFQKERIFKGSSALHDVDVYLVILGRIRRYINNLASSNSRVANLKGNYQYLMDKIDIRNRFEHEDNIDIETFSETDISELPILKGSITASIATIKVINSVFINKQQALIVSGDLSWDLHEDHRALLEMVGRIKLCR